MALQIRTAATIELPSTIKMMVYGQAGMGKTTLALSMPSPLLIDFDGGVSRVHTSHMNGVAVAQVKDWAEVKELFGMDLTAYQTIVIDTAGKMMDMIITHRCGMRQPKISDWGGINAEFNNFTRMVSSLGKNIVYVAHRESTKDGDNMVYVPMLRAKNFTAIVAELDLLGYLEMRQTAGRVERTITFNPTDRSEGKNACNLPGVMTIPTNIDENGNPIVANDFLTICVLKPYLRMLQDKRQKQTEYQDRLAGLEKEVATIKDATGANEFVSSIDKWRGDSSLLAKARQMFGKRASELGLSYDKGAGKYV